MVFGCALHPTRRLRVTLVWVIPVTLANPGFPVTKKNSAARIALSLGVNFVENCPIALKKAVTITGIMRPICC